MNFKMISMAEDFRQFSVNLTTNVSFQLHFGFLLVVSKFFLAICQLSVNPSRPSIICPKWTLSVTRNSCEHFSESESYNFPRPLLLENCLLLGTDNAQAPPISGYIFETNGGYCLHMLLII